MSSSNYYPHEIESKIQKYWQENASFKAVEDPSKEKYYCLSMFPYPSGKLHMGHVRNYTIGDVLSRFQRLKGKNVMQPMGWDAFGMPAENAAIANNIPPAKWTRENIAYMKKQLKALGFGYDWDRELATCNPEYYQWEQWFFTKLVEKGLAYKKKSIVNWDPVDKTVLANEQVIEGRGWRSGALVEKREIPQWFLRITNYAEELLQDLDKVDWPEKVKIMQRNWIGKSKGVTLDFALASAIDNLVLDKLTVYTTRPDTLFGVTYIAIAAAHPLATFVAQDNKEVADFIELCKKGGASEAEMATAEKLGFDTGLSAIHPLTGKQVPIWIANFVLAEYGTGAVMSVPAHDERDFEFAKKYSLPIIQVIKPQNDEEINLNEQAFTEHGLLINSDEFDNMDFETAFDAIGSVLEQKGLGKIGINYRLRDWGVSRQRYWGTPIPMETNSAGDMRTAQEFPIVLPEDVGLDATGSPLKKMPEFYELADGWQRETDTFDTFMESSWYFAKFCSPNSDAMLDERANYWLPVDDYVGGIEHAILHLLYARFFHKLLRDFGLVKSDEPFKRLLTQGMVVADTYYREDENGRKTWFNPADVELEKDAKGRVVRAYLLKDGKDVEIGGMEKMSKSKNNGIDPQSMIDKYGADTVRLFTMFASPPDLMLEWSDAGVEGAQRYLNRLWRLVVDNLAKLKSIENNAKLDKANLSKLQKEMRYKIHTTLAKVEDDYDRRRTFNTAIAACMELTNALSKFVIKDQQDALILKEGLEILLLMLSPVAPHITHQLWQDLGNEAAIIDERWDRLDKSALVAEEIEIAIQVNGKLRGQIQASNEADEEELKQEALEHPRIKKFIEDKQIKKVIYVKGKLINIVAV